MRISAKLLVLYVPSLDRRLIEPEAAPSLSRCLTRCPPIELETHPSVELLPSLVTGVWPHQHHMWQVRLKPDSKATVTNRMIDVLPDRWTTTWQCVRHRFNRDYDLPTIEPRRGGGSNYIALRCSAALAAATPVRFTAIEFSHSFRC